MSDQTLKPFFSPKGVAIIGASTEPAKLGYVMARNLLRSGYSGAMHYVNPKGGSLFDRPLYKNIRQVPNPFDLAVILVAAPVVPETLKACAARGIKAAIIATGGFREAGAEGAALEEECLRIARKHGMRLIGPNCIGLMDTHLPLDATFLPPPPPTAGEVAFLSHSGAICCALIDWMRGQGMGLSRLVSLGNQVDVTETDLLTLTADDPHTRVITLYIESIRDGQRFMLEAIKASLEKPIVALKVGRSAAGQMAAASHTGALAGAEAAYDAAFRKAGILRADNTEEAFHWARALAWCPLPKGGRVAILTNAGGPGVTAADSLEANGLELAALSEDTLAGMRAVLPPFASLNNPVDILASAPPDAYAVCLKLLLDDPGVDSAMVIVPPPPAFSAGAVAKAIIPVIQSSDKPVVVVPMGDHLIQESLAFLHANQIVDYRFAERAVSALGALWQRAKTLEQLRAPAPKAPTVKTGRAGKLLAQLPAGSFVSQDIAASLMTAAGIRTADCLLAKSTNQAVSIAEQLDYPVVMKIASVDISHKSDVGGVALNLESQAAVRVAFDNMTARVKAARPEAHIDGVTLQRMLPPGQEVIVGVVRDPQFGPLVMFGSGGVEVEGLKDVTFALAPLSRREAEEMLDSTWAGRKLSGYRNIPPADREAVVEALLRLARLTELLPEIQEIEINPLRVMPPGEGAWAVDVRVKV
ncbi:MAG: acetate--CoA ligase family protein [Anaerolineaceae bacterium]|nr:acetate--CoA ligase family protein [Anaerolineaceae bacterium]